MNWQSPTVQISSCDFLVYLEAQSEVEKHQPSHYSHSDHFVFLTLIFKLIC